MGLDPYEDPNDGGGSWTDWCMKLKAEPKKDVVSQIKRFLITYLRSMTNLHASENVCTKRVAI